MRKTINGGSLIGLALLALSMIGCNKNEILTPDQQVATVPAKDSSATGTRDLPIEAATFYIAPNGNDANPGTIDKPFKSWDKIINLVKPGDLVYLRGGVYQADPSKQNGACLKGKSGLAGQYIRFWAYPGELPILDCSTMKMVNSISGLEFSGDYWYFKGIDVRNLPQPRNSSGVGYFCVGFSAQNCNNNIFENVRVHNCSCIGYYLGGSSTNNLFLNCDSHRNYDPYTYDSNGKLYDGGNADGFHITLTNSNAVNTFRYCRSWSNSDDGFDCWGTEGIINFDGCWSFRNGYLPGTTTAKGDGQGFKLGETYNPADGTFHKVVTDCVSFENREHGFDQSDATCLMAFENNIAYNNKGLGFYMAKNNLKFKFKNNIAINNSIDRSDKTTQVIITTESDNTNNSWNGIGGDASQFISVDTKGVDADRKADGSLPDCNYLKLKTTSIYMDKGVDVGLPFKGTAPDLGPFESTCCQ